MATWSEKDWATAAPLLGEVLLRSEKDVGEALKAAVKALALSVALGLAIGVLTAIGSLFMLPSNDPTALYPPLSYELSLRTLLGGVLGIGVVLLALSLTVRLLNAGKGLNPAKRWANALTFAALAILFAIVMAGAWALQELAKWLS